MMVVNCVLLPMIKSKAPDEKLGPTTLIAADHCAGKIYYLSYINGRCVDISIYIVFN